MIIVKKIKWRNFLSTGNVWTEITLNKNKTTLIVGENGSGKSTLLDALSFALFSKPFRKINKPQLVNSVNKKEMEVELTFSIGQDNYLIRRGLKPNLFEIWKNNELINQDSAARDYQLYLEQNILKMNFKSFGQIVVLGSASFVPFMQLPAAHRREVIEDLLDIQVFTTMSNLLKEKIADNKSALMQSKHDEDLFEHKLNSAKDHNEEIRRLKTVEVDRIKDKAREQLKFIDDEQKIIDIIEVETSELIASTADRDEIKSKSEELKVMQRKVSERKNTLLKEVMFYTDHDNCPVCKQGIEDHFKHSTIEAHQQKLTEIELNESKVTSKLSQLQDRQNEISEIDQLCNKNHLKAGEHRANIRISKNLLLQLKDDLQRAEKEVEEIDNSKIVELLDEIQKCKKATELLTLERDLHQVSASILKDSGIKSKIIRQYVPVINSLINKYLAALEFVVSFELDDQFNETIKSRFRDDFSYASFSEGEKIRIDLAILFTWRAIAKMRNSVSTNLLILDEIVDGATDADGIDNLVGIINTLGEGQNIFVISHSSKMMDKLENTLQFEKEKGFSRLLT